MTRAEVTWIIEKHGLFQSYLRFCDWDQASFDPDYASRPLDYFKPLLRRIFSRSVSDYSADPSAV